MVGIVYKIKNQINNKVYIGITTRDLFYRVKGHIYDSYTRNNKSLFHKAIRKYGEQNFTIQILQIVFSSIQELEQREKYWIKFFLANNPNFGYNLTSGGETNKIVSESTREKQRLAKLKNPTKYWLNKKIPDDVKKQISQTVKLNPSRGMLNKRHSKKTKQLMSKNKKGKTYDDPKYDEMKKLKSKKLKGHKAYTRSIVQLSNDFHFIKTYNSIDEVQRTLGRGSYGLACQGKRITAKGYRWMYYEDFIIFQQQRQIKVEEELSNL